MQKHILRFLVVLAAVTVAHPFEHIEPVALAQDTAARAASVFAEAKKALGGEEQLRSVKALQAAGGFRRSMGEMQIEGELEILVEPPDKLRRNEEMILPMGTVVRSEVLNGEEVWEDSSQHGGMAHGGMMIRMAPGGSTADPERMKEMLRRMRKMELARLSLAWLLLTDAHVSHAGIAEAPDGKADVLEIKPPDGPLMRLFVDQQTHMPLMLAWKGPQPRVMVRRGGPGGAAPNPEQIARDAAAEGPPPEANFEMRFAEYRSVDGIQLPHEIVRAINGAVNEEWTVKSYKVNPSFKANTFSK